MSENRGRLGNSRQEIASAETLRHDAFDIAMLPFIREVTSLNDDLLNTKQNLLRENRTITVKNLDNQARNK